MPTPVSTHSDLLSANNAPTRLPFDVADEVFQQTRLKLMQALQTTLDVNIILELFHQHLQPLVNSQSLNYRNSEQECQVLIGKEQSHRAHYRLRMETGDLGEISFSSSKRFTEHQLAGLEQIITTLVCPLRNALQYRAAIKMAMRDPLTDTGNRAALNEALQREVQMASRYDQPLSLLAIDIDYFKSVNDNYGHSVGDDVLKEVAQAIKAVTRQTDVTFRYGGEEFVVLLSKTPSQGAQIIAERIRKFIEKMRIESQQHLVSVTISLGCATLEQGEDDKQLFQRADAALYRAKGAGRNQIACAEILDLDSGDLDSEDTDISSCEIHSEQPQPARAV